MLDAARRTSYNGRLKQGKDIEQVANHKSALKAHRRNVKTRAHNREFRSRLRRAIRAARAAIDGRDAAIDETLRGTVSLIDKLAGKGIIHPNAAARYKSRLSRRATNASAAA